MNSCGANIICHVARQAIYYSELSSVETRRCERLFALAAPFRFVVRYRRRRRRRHKTRKGPTVSVASSNNPVPPSSLTRSTRLYAFVVVVVLLTYTHGNKIPAGGVMAGRLRASPARVD